MSIKINIPYFLSYLINVEVTEVNGKTIGDCLRCLVRQFPEIKGNLFDNEDNLCSHLVVAVNDEVTDPVDLTQTVNDGDELSIEIRFIEGG